MYVDFLSLIPDSRISSDSSFSGLSISRSIVRNLCCNPLHGHKISQVGQKLIDGFNSGIWNRRREIFVEHRTYCTKRGILQKSVEQFPVSKIQNTKYTILKIFPTKNEKCKQTVDVPEKSGYQTGEK